MCRPLEAPSRRSEASRRRPSACSTDARNFWIIAAIASPRRSRAAFVSVSTAESRVRSIMVSRNTITVRAMAAISSCPWVAGMRAVVSPSASRSITPASPSRGSVMERPIAKLQSSPIRTDAQPTAMMKRRICAREASRALAAELALARAAALILSASGRTLSVSWLMSDSNGWILSVLATHCAKL